MSVYNVGMLLLLGCAATGREPGDDDERQHSGRISYLERKRMPSCRESTDSRWLHFMLLWSLPKKAHILLRRLNSAACGGHLKKINDDNDDNEESA